MTNLVQIRDGEASAEIAAEKERRLLAQLRKLSSVIVALSGGTDSAYLAWAAHQVLGGRALSVTATSPSYSAFDREQVESFLRATGARHEFIETHELENPAYRVNDASRCYYCKDELFSMLDAVAAERHYAAVAYGVNADDTSDFRPGQRAAAEHRVLTPLLDAQLHKLEIRLLALRAGLPMWDRPASACLASRLPYGTEVTEERLALVERGEAVLRRLGFRQFRVRLHDKLGRVEVAPEELPRALTPEIAAAIAAGLKQAGFRYVTLDLEGYRQGSLNEGLKKAAGT
ncbi:MAG TPA: ATP-dependent sacrificial sulfur transferase LarE [Candidatus Eremiobacteraceae bacterium]|nr:ATP-dependent sacrificial sulfur transferase LarE [Candidatus Eremiobacteraceae bacterium]